MEPWTRSHIDTPADIMMGYIFPYGLGLEVIVLILTSPRLGKFVSVLKWILGITSVLVLIGLVLIVWLNASETSDNASAGFGLAMASIPLMFVVLLETTVLLIVESIAVVYLKHFRGAITIETKGV